MLLKACRSVLYQAARTFKRSQATLKKCSPRKILGPPWRILFFGTDNFALTSLKPLCAKLRTGTLISDLGVVSKEKSLVRKFGEEEKLVCHSWPLEVEDISSKYDIGIVVSFGNLIGKSVIDSFPLGCINVHASVLPELRGAAPIIHAIMNGHIETGVTIMKIHPHKFDVGEIVRQYRTAIGLHETAQELENRLALLGAQLLMECVRDLPRCVQMATPQPKLGATYAPKIDSSMSNVDWGKLSATEVYNRHRALGAISPLKTTWKGFSLKLVDLKVDELKKPTSHESQTSLNQSALDFLNPNSLPASSKMEQTQDAGLLEFCKNSKSLKVKCCDGNQVIINTIRISGKNISALDFYNGFLYKEPKENWKFTVVPHRTSNVP